MKVIRRIVLLTFFIISFNFAVLNYNQIFKHFFKKNSIQNKKLQNISSTEKPYVYEDEVDLRIVVMTFDRNASVLKLLNSLQTLELDGDKASLEIWLDHDSKGNIDELTLETVRAFEWIKGPTRIYSHSSKAGILGQWIDTWRPKYAPTFQNNYSLIENETFVASNYREICLLLEDDLTVSSQAYRWIKAVHHKYAGRTDFSGVTLQSNNVKAHDTDVLLKAPINQSAYMYVCIGTWGFSPSSLYWAMFQNWYHEKRSTQNVKKFQPLLPNNTNIGNKVNSWFSGFTRAGNEDSMWEMWFIYFTNMRNLLTVYSNLKYVRKKTKSSLGVHREEVGLHYKKKGADKYNLLLKNWNTNYETLLPDEPIKFGWKGQKLN